jgi:hypothetical protein
MLATSDLEIIENTLTQAMQCAIAKGWAIQRDLTYCSEFKECCAIGAILVCELKTPITQDEVDNLLLTVLQDAIREHNIDLPNDWVPDFINGFDMGYCDQPENYPNPDAFALGSKLADKYVQD